MTLVLILLLGQAVPNSVAATRVSNLNPGEISSLTALGLTPINPVVLESLLREHPDRSLVDLIVSGFRFGFPLHYKGPRVHSSCKNLKSIYGNEEAALLKIQKELVE